MIPNDYQKQPAKPAPSGLTKLFERKKEGFKNLNPIDFNKDGKISADELKKFQETQAAQEKELKAAKEKLEKELELTQKAMDKPVKESKPNYY